MGPRPHVFPPAGPPINLYGVFHYEQRQRSFARGILRPYWTGEEISINMGIMGGCFIEPELRTSQVLKQWHSENPGWVSGVPASL
jgi:hypothetical protein